MLWPTYHDWGLMILYKISGMLIRFDWWDINKYQNYQRAWNNWFVFDFLLLIDFGQMIASFCKNWNPLKHNRCDLKVMIIAWALHYQPHISWTVSWIEKSSRLYGFSKLFSYISGQLKSKRTKNLSSFFFEKSILVFSLCS